MSAVLRKADRRKSRARLRAGAFSSFWVLAAWLAMALGSSHAAAATLTAHSADSFVESIGINTHTSFNDTPYYSQFDGVKERLAELGVHHIREDLVPNRPDQYQALNELASIGIKSTLILGDPRNGTTGLETLLSTLEDNLSGAVEAVEGPNEYGSRGGPGWAQQLSEYQQQLYTDVKSDPALSSLPVIGPSLVHRSEQESLGDISGSLDFGNIHPYPNGEPPESNLANQLSRAAINSGSKPVMATETGYSNAIAGSGGTLPVSEEATATYMPRLFLEYFRSGVVRTYAYELVDEWPDPAHNEIESDFGLLRNNLSPKPAFTALQNLISITSDPGPSFEPQSLSVTLGGDVEGLHELLLQKRDGTYYLALWRATSVWDPNARTPLSSPSAPVELEFGPSVQAAERYEPNISAAPLDSVPVQASHHLTLEVGPQVVILRLSMGPQETLGRARLWVSRHSVPAGGQVMVRGRLPASTTGTRLPVTLQSWQPKTRKWLTVSHARASTQGVFRRGITVLPGRYGRRPRLRAIASQVRPSRPVRIRISRRGKGSVAIAERRPLPPA